MDKTLKSYYEKQIKELINQINTCDYSDNGNLIDLLGALAAMIKNILDEL